MEEIALAILKSIKDPMLIVILCVVFGLYRLLINEKKVMGSALKDLSENLAHCGKTLERLSVLVEVLVAQRRSNGAS